MTTWQFREPEVIKYDPREFLAGQGDGEFEDVSCFTRPTHVVRFAVRRKVSLFGHTLWTGSWQPMQIVVR